MSTLLVRLFMNYSHFALPSMVADRNELLRQIANTEEPPAIRNTNHAVPAALETVILKALRKDSGERYSTAQELSNDLQRFLNHQPILASLRKSNRTLAYVEQSDTPPP